MLKSLSWFGPCVTVFGVFMGGRAEAGTVYIRSGVDAHEHIAASNNEVHEDLKDHIRQGLEEPEHVAATSIKVHEDLIGHVRWGADAPERYAAANIKVYENLLAVRDVDPVDFDRRHRFYAQLITNPTFAEKLVRRWQRDEQRFEYWHPYLWRVIDGYQELHPTPAPPIVSPPPSPETNPPTSSPEPSTWLLLAIGAIFVGLKAPAHSTASSPVPASVR
jgi:hypothetical protein